jgi:hypothetical protein
MSKLDPRIEAIRVKYDLEPTDFWELPQKKGTWVAKHSALEIVAVKADIRFSAPQIIEANTSEGIAVLSVTGSMYERVSDKESRQLREEWATGEASPKNNKNAYPWAMAEKRAKDRVILKLVGIHGLVYSEDEMPEPPERSVASTSRVAANSSSLTEGEGGTALTRGPATQEVAKPRLSRADARDVYAKLQTDLRAKGLDLKGIKEWLALPDTQSAVLSLPEDWELNMRDAIKQAMEEAKEGIKP